MEDSNMINEIWNGDCLELMRKIPDQSIDLILCDLPYGTTKCKWDVIIPFDKLWEQYNRISKDTTPIVLNSSQPFTSILINSNLANFKYLWIWEKNVPSNIACSNFQPMRYTEDVCVFYRKFGIFNKQLIERAESGKNLIKQYQNNNTTFKVSKSEVSSDTSGEVTPFKYDCNLKNPSNIIKFNTERGRNHLHPTQKPLALCEYLIKTYTNENELVLDNCAGSGTTLLAAKNLNRNYIGIEKEKEYYDICLERLK